MKIPRLNKLESIILQWVSYDYETIEYIAGNVSTDYGEKVTFETLHSTLLKLKKLGLVESYYYSSQDRNFIKQEPVGGYPEREIFWHISNEDKNSG